MTAVLPCQMTLGTAAELTQKQQTSWHGHTADCDRSLCDATVLCKLRCAVGTDLI